VGQKDTESAGTTTSRLSEVFKPGGTEIRQGMQRDTIMVLSAKCVKKISSGVLGGPGW